VAYNYRLEEAALYLWRFSTYVIVKLMLILTKRLRLSNFKMDFADEFTRTLNDPKIFEYLPESVPDLNDIKILSNGILKGIYRMRKLDLRAQI